MNRFLNFTGGLLLGILAGSIAGLLMAPKPGSELRKEMQQEIDDILAEARAASEQRRRELEDEFSRLQGSDSTDLS